MSLPQKVTVIMSRINAAKLSGKTDEAIKELLLDPNGVQKLAKVASDIDFSVDAAGRVKKLANAVADVMPRAFYTSGKTALAAEERELRAKERQEQLAEDIMTGGFEEVEQPPEFAHGGVIRRQQGGLVTPGNIDVNKLPAVRNPDGTVSTVRSMSINVDGKEVLIPTVINGRVVSDEEAIQSYLKTGRHLGIFSSPEAATAYGKSLSAQEAQRVKKARGGYTLQEELLLKRYANR